MNTSQKAYFAGSILHEVAKAQLNDTRLAGISKQRLEHYLADKKHLIELSKCYDESGLFGLFSSKDQAVVEQVIETVRTHYPSYHGWRIWNAYQAIADFDDAIESDAGDALLDGYLEELLGQRIESLAWFDEVAA